jgi:ribosomal-protein-alanine N-acetyltransferase
VIYLRPATLADTRAIADIDLHPDVYRWLDLSVAEDVDPEEWSRAYVGWITRPDHRCVVAVMDEVVVGTVTLRWSLGRTDADCMALKVAPSAQSRGIGKLLMDWLISEAAQMGLARVVLEVRAENDRAKRLYAKLGFEIDHRLPDGFDRMVRKIQR